MEPFYGEDYGWQRREFVFTYVGVKIRVVNCKQLYPFWLVESEKGIIKER